MKQKINKTFLCTTKTKQKLSTNERQIKTVICVLCVCADACVVKSAVVFGLENDA